MLGIKCTSGSQQRCRLLTAYLLETIATGSIFSEMALISKDARDATARRRATRSSFPLTKKRFPYMVRSTPMFALPVMDVMSPRLRAMNTRITST